jgi:hypothetical protein
MECSEQRLSRILYPYYVIVRIVPGLAIRESYDQAVVGVASLFLFDFIIIILVGEVTLKEGVGSWAGQ